MKKAFTLIELVAVIVIISIILLIAVPKVINYISITKKSSLEDTIKMISSSAEKEYATRELLGTLDQKNNPITCEDVVKLESSIYSNCILTFKNGVASTELTGEDYYDGYFCSGNKEISNCELMGSNVFYDESKKVNKPQLAIGMTPIKWNGTTWIDTTVTDVDWYDYDTKKWANARTADGSMWVWIPRYIYKISTNWHTNTAGTVDVLFSEGLNDNWNSSVIGNIEAGASATSSNNKWTNQPAFKFGDKELYGIWVAKFEATALEGVVNPYTADGSCSSVDDNVLTKNIKIVPNATSWRCITISNAFTLIRNMEINSSYGWELASGLQTNGTFTTDTNNIDTHLMKNIEWGAIAYLSKSIYGKNTEEVYVNNSQTFTVGCAGNTATSGAYNGCQNVYDSATGIKASTTGNIYGIYDLSGGAWEYQAAHVNNSNIGQGAVVRNSIDKYKDVYPITTDTAALNYDSSINLKGEAVYETSSSYSGSTSWFGDYSGMPSGGNSYMIRGGRFANGASSGLYASGGSWAGVNSTNGFRPVLLVHEGL